METRPALLTFKEACEQLGKTEKQGRWMLASGDFPKVAKIGGRLMTRQIDIDAYVTSKFEPAA